MRYFLFFIGFFAVQIYGFSQHQAFVWIDKGETEKFEKFYVRTKKLNQKLESNGENLIGEIEKTKFNLLEWSAVKGRAEILEMILSDSTKIQDFHTSVSRALVLSIPFGQYIIFDLLISAGANLNYKSDLYYGQDAIHLSLVYKNYNLFFYLLKKEADINVRNEYEMSLIHQAAQFGNYKILDTLNNLGLSLEDRDAFMRTPIMYAAWNASFKNFDYLMKKNVQVDNISSKNENLVIFASAGGDPDIVDEVLQLDLDINQQDDLGNSPMHYAVAEDDVATVEKLFDNKADPLIKNLNGESVLDWAIEGKSYDCMLFFLRRLKLSKKEYWGPIRSNFDTRFWRRRFKTYLVK